MSKPQTKKNGTPVVIIVLVLAAAVIVASIYYNSSRTTPPANKTQTPNVNTPRPPGIPPNAPAGAQPPNFLGSPNASVTVEEFADFQCPACGQKYPVLHQIQSIYGPRIKFIFRHFPLPMHDKAYDAAVAAEAAGLQGSDKFWAMHAQLYTNQQTWSADANYKQVFRSYAEKIGLDIDRFETDMAGLQTKNRVGADMERGKALNINTTPTVYVNGKDIPFLQMDASTLQKIIDDELRAAQASRQPAQPAPAANSNNPAAVKK